MLVAMRGGGRDPGVQTAFLPGREEDAFRDAHARAGNARRGGAHRRVNGAPSDHGALPGDDRGAVPRVAHGDRGARRDHGHDRPKPLCEGDWTDPVGGWKTRPAEKR